MQHLVPGAGGKNGLALMETREINAVLKTPPKASIGYGKPSGMLTVSLHVATAAGPTAY
jgi:hypothetical protein